MNITLSADKELIRLAREYAKRHNSSLNALIRDYLTRLVEEMDSASAAAEFAHLASEFAGRSPEGFTFNRDEIYDRGQ
jgi:hypothetical protein